MDTIQEYAETEGQIEVTVIPAGNVGYFRTLLLPNAAQALEDENAEMIAVGAVKDGIACGALAVEVYRDVIQIVSLYVAPDYRRQGAGQAMFNTLRFIFEGVPTDVQISFTVTQKEHEALPAFLEAMGFVDETDDYLNTYYISLADIGATSFFSKAGKADTVTPFAALSEYELSRLSREVSVAEAPIPEDGLNGPLADKNVSCVYKKDQSFPAYVALEKRPSGSLALYAWAQPETNPSVLPMLLRAAYGRAKELYPPETNICISAVNETSAELVHAILPGARTISRSYSRLL